MQMKRAWFLVLILWVAGSTHAWYQIPLYFEIMWANLSFLPFLTDRVLGIPEIKLKVILDQPVGHCAICIIYAVPPGNTNKVFYKEKKSSDSNEIMFFQNKQYTTLEVVGTENSTIQAIVFCIL